MDRHIENYMSWSLVIVADQLCLEIWWIISFPVQVKNRGKSYGCWMIERRNCWPFPSTSSTISAVVTVQPLLVDEFGEFW